MNDAQLALIAEAMKKPLEDVKKEYEEFLVIILFFFSLNNHFKYRRNFLMV